MVNLLVTIPRRRRHSPGNRQLVPELLQVPPCPVALAARRRERLAQGRNLGVPRPQQPPYFTVERVHLGLRPRLAPELVEEKVAVKVDVVRLRMLLLQEGLGVPVQQTGKPSYAHKLTNAELEIDWGLSSEEILRSIRIGRAWTTVSGSRLRIHEAKIGTSDNLRIGEREGSLVGAGEGAIELLEVQPEGRKQMPVKDWINGLPVNAGGYLGHE